MKRRLRAALSERGWSQKDLRDRLELDGDAIGVGTISQAFNPDHKGLPSARTLAKIVTGLRLPQRERFALQQLRVRADREHGPWWGSFLAAAQEASAGHLLDAVGVGAPRLSDIYVRQRVIAYPATAGLGGSVESEILEQEDPCVVLAEAGGGKTSLLHAIWARSTGAWLEEGPQTVVPILVTAASLTAPRPLPDLLAHAVTTGLSPYGLLEELPVSAFRTAPHPGTRWLIMVDGLDEILEPRMRCDVLLRCVAFGNRQPADSPYRFVFATRPLPAEEMELLGPGTRRYQLQPFQLSEIPVVAEKWFSVLDPGNAERTASAFVSELQRRRLFPLAANPLMAGLLCQLYGAHPGGGLPGHRSDIYRDFVAYLYRRQARGDGVGDGALLPQTQASLSRYGPEVVKAAMSTLVRLPHLTAYVAAERQAGSTASPLAILLSRPEAASPVWALDGLRQVWETFLVEGLRRSGLFTIQSGELSFAHHTLQEYLAARYIASDPSASKRALKNLFQKQMKRPRFYLPKIWEPPYEEDDDSFSGFLIDAWTNSSSKHAVESALLRVATRGGDDWIVSQAMMGTRLPKDVVAVVADIFIALPSELSDGYWEVACAGQVAKLGDSRGFETLARLVREQSLDEEDRFKAAWELAYLCDQRGTASLKAMVDNTAIASELRIRAACALLEFADPYGAQALAALAGEDRGPTPWTPKAEPIPHSEWEQFEQMRRITNTLHRYASQLRSDEETQLMVAAALSRRNEAGDRDTFSNLACDPTLSTKIRIMMAAVLARLGDYRGRDTLEALGGDESVAGFERIDAADVLADCADPRYQPILEQIVISSLTNHPPSTGDEGFQAAHLLIYRGGEEGRSTLHQLAVNPALHAGIRLKASMVLAESHDWRGLQALEILSHDPLAQPEVRAWAERHLRDTKRPQGR
ncbi:hypothetical protein [Streptomyces phaeochromogenes]|uniref:hypothetical protein n=1 Tax=Streptomyces phaeochromogenes TaxID=1923 RepID=UPI0012FEA0FD|nr:hypothetical protein [Streptomyces phaeochromogenes]